MILKLHLWLFPFDYCIIKYFRPDAKSEHFIDNEFSTLGSQIFIERIWYYMQNKIFKRGVEIFILLAVKSVVPKDLPHYELYEE